MYDLIETEGDDTQDDQRGDQIVQLEDLACIDDQISKSLPCGKKFPDDHAHQTKPDIDFQNADDGRKAGRENDASEHLNFIAAQSVDQFDLLFIGFTKGGVHADDAPEDCNGHTGDDDGSRAGSKPDDQKRGKGGFGQAVQDHKPWFQYFGERAGEPEDGSGQKADQDHQGKA